jgi:hypothetical protein
VVVVAVEVLAAVVVELAAVVVEETAGLLHQVPMLPQQTLAAGVVVLVKMLAQILLVVMEALALSSLKYLTT